MKTYEVGVLPQSTFFFFSPNEQAMELFYYQTMCGHFFCTEEYYIKRETFPPLLLVYVCRGALHLDLETGSDVARAGQGLFFDCAQPHHYYAEGDLEFLFVHFDGPKAHALCRYINALNGVLLDNENCEKIGQALHSLLAFYEAGGSESVVASSARLYELVALLDDPYRSPRVRRHDDSINRAVAYVREHVGEKITLHQLAEISGLSDYYFSHVFKEMTGVSPSSFIIYSRVDRAKVLLASTDLPISEIAAQVGYANSSNLITLFTQRVGCSPLQFRKRNRLSHTGR